MNFKPPGAIASTSVRRSIPATLRDNKKPRSAAVNGIPRAYNPAVSRARLRLFFAPLSSFNIADRIMRARARAPATVRRIGREKKNRNEAGLSPLFISPRSRGGRLGISVIALCALNAFTLCAIYVSFMTPRRCRRVGRVWKLPRV